MRPKRTSNIKFFLDQYEWKEINFPSEGKKEKEKTLKTTTKQCFLMFCFQQAL